MPGTNLTREEAATRAALVTVGRHHVALDVTTGPETFSTTSTIQFTLHPARRRDLPRLRRGHRRGDHRERASTSTRPSTTPTAGCACPGLAAENVVVVVATGRYTNTGEGLHRFVDPVDDEVYLYSQFEVPDSRADVRRSSSSPTSRPASPSRSPRPAHWQVVSNSPTPSPTRPATATATLALRRHRADLDATSPRWSPARTTWCATTVTSRRGEVPARHLLPPLAVASTSTPTTSSTSPSAASRSSRRSSTAPTRSRSTTSSSRRSTTRARWRTPAA